MLSFRHNCILISPPIMHRPRVQCKFLTQLTAALRPFFTDAAGRVLLLITASPDVADAAQTSQVHMNGNKAHECYPLVRHFC